MTDTCKICGKPKARHQPAAGVNRIIAHQFFPKSVDKAMAERVTQRIMRECYQATAANDDWDSNFDETRCAEILIEEFGL